MLSLPLNFKLTGRRCLVVGGGVVALRKARLLDKAGAKIHVIAPELCAGLSELLTERNGVFARRTFSAGDCQGFTLVVSATNCHETNKAVSHECMAANIPVNVVDTPQLCSVTFAAVIDRSPLSIAVSSNGASPVLTRHLKQKLDTLVPASYGELAGLFGRYRDEIKQALPDVEQRRYFLESLLESPIAEQAMAGRMAEAERALTEALSQQFPAIEQGEVYLVGAGPGDPDLLTFKALRLMQRADVVVYDRLVSEPILAMCRKDAEFIYVGKARADHALPQQNINSLLVELAKSGKRVCRLKGGDPFIFGRGGEEIEELAAYKVPFQVVPGITAAAGCASYAGIPLTHRDHAQSVRFVTGHLRDGQPDLPWSELIHPQQTLVLYMGLVSLAPIREALLNHGMDGNTPVALISKGTTPQQQVLVGTLNTIMTQFQECPLPAPTLIIVGSVVSLQEKLRWFHP